MKLKDLYSAIFICGTYLVISAVLHGDFRQANIMYCIGVAFGYLFGAYRVRAEFRRQLSGK